VPERARRLNECVVAREPYVPEEVIVEFGEQAPLARPFDAAKQIVEEAGGRP
jgi:hypothetical protein